MMNTTMLPAERARFPETHFHLFIATNKTKWMTVDLQAETSHLSGCLFKLHVHVFDQTEQQFPVLKWPMELLQIILPVVISLMALFQYHLDVGASALVLWAVLFLYPVFTVPLSCKQFSQETTAMGAQSYFGWFWDQKNFSLSEPFTFLGYCDVTDPDRRVLFHEKEPLPLKEGGAELSGWHHSLKLPAMNRAVMTQSCTTLVSLVTIVPFSDTSSRSQEKMCQIVKKGHCIWRNVLFIYASSLLPPNFELGNFSPIKSIWNSQWNLLPWKHLGCLRSATVTCEIITS